MDLYIPEKPFENIPFRTNSASGIPRQGRGRPSDFSVHTQLAPVVRYQGARNYCRGHLSEIPGIVYFAICESQ